MCPTRAPALPSTICSAAIPVFSSARFPTLTGTVRALALTTAERSALLPSVPTFAEAGFPGYDVPLRWGLAAPAGTPRDVIAALNHALNAALATDEVRQRLAVE